MDAEWDKLKDVINKFWSFAVNGGNNSTETKRKIFHYLGFLIYAEKYRIHDLHQKWLDYGDDEKFADFLFKEVKQYIQSSLNGKQLEDLIYPQNKKTIQNILLLFNLAYMIKEFSSCFKFNRFVVEQWSLEHIYAQNSESVCPIKDKANIEEKEEEIKEWLEEVMEYLKDDNPREKNLKNS
ncbi:hypothetical protein HHE02_02730 [Helicobacter heilmannii]|uniref:hypothetical protein n=1 Tax=Helicobacter heilmannii TaxID=35817 RepID=UPI0006A06BA1|nr:hypothetical protein [Helicobacter heilmannii]CRF46990.1 hypothetical protein HHE02_02730 [Helicobacter heilmannii]CRF51722.1 hypothetical protein HHE06_16200 [Helicobacter heilmannii]